MASFTSMHRIYLRAVERWENMCHPLVERWEEAINLGELFLIWIFSADEIDRPTRYHRCCMKSCKWHGSKHGPFVRMGVITFRTRHLSAPAENIQFGSKCCTT